MVQDGVKDQHVREPESDACVGDGRAEATDQMRRSLACSVHGGTVRPCCHCAQAKVSVTVAMCGSRDRVWEYSSLEQKVGSRGTRSGISSGLCSESLLKFLLVCQASKYLFF
jgi:hypothetical protein